MQGKTYPQNRPANTRIVPCNDGTGRGAPDMRAHVSGLRATGTGHLKGVVVVVPAVATDQQCHQPVVAGLVAGAVGLAAPDVHRGVHQPAPAPAWLSELTLLRFVGLSMAQRPADLCCGNLRVLQQGFTTGSHNGRTAGFTTGFHHSVSQQVGTIGYNHFINLHALTCRDASGFHLPAACNDIDMPPVGDKRSLRCHGTGYSSMPFKPYKHEPPTRSYAL